MDPASATACDALFSSSFFFPPVLNSPEDRRLQIELKIQSNPELGYDLGQSDAAIFMDPAKWYFGCFALLGSGCFFEN
ncbi:unnamed protein product [Prunus armeniaca]|uniref:Uncharacterized protein n=1 Tax=Prunus armeniaca TaxID=36596 RepID=A0A6J5WVI2_PRUAR|nr:unnamed protein product [Prunus armeniaca]